MSPIAEMVNPKHTVVMVHDMQNDFLHEDGIFKKAGESIDVSGFLGDLVGLRGEGPGARGEGYGRPTSPACRTWGPTMTRWSTSGGTWSGSRASTSTPTRRFSGRGDARPSTPWRPQEGDIVINKYRTNTFVHSTFELILRSHGIKTFISTGVATEVGILPTAWTGTQLGFFPVIPRDLVGARVAELHEEAMKFMERLVWVMDSSEILDAWDKGYDQGG